MKAFLKKLFSGNKPEAVPELRTKFDKSKIKGTYVDLKHTLLTEFHDYFHISFTEKEKGLLIDIYGNHQTIGMKEFIKFVHQNNLYVIDIIISCTSSGIQVRIDADEVPYPYVFEQMEL